MSLRTFQDVAKKRGLSDLGLLSTDPWETLDREGIIVPVAYSLGPNWDHETPTRVDAGFILVREEEGYRPWNELQAEALEKAGADHPYDVEAAILYQHWQLFLLAEIQESLRLPLIPGNLGEGLESFYETREQAARLPKEGPPREYLRDLGARWRATELLLVRVQNFFMPLERDGRYRGGAVLGLGDDAADWTITQRDRFDFAAAASDCGTSADELADLYEQLGRTAIRLDPNRKLFWLLDQVGRRHKEELQGDALRALDYYDAARVIRRWHERITRTWLPDVDELVGSGADRAKENLFGKRDIRHDRSVLAPILEHYGLYPWRVELVGEGPSELDALGEVLEYGYGTSFARLGIHTTAMRTADIPANAELLLASMREYANYFLLVFDNEGRARELVDELLRRGVIEGVSDAQRAQALEEGLKAVREQTFASEPDRREALRAARERAQRLEEEPGQAPEFQLWKENLEASNFSLAELCAVVNGEAARRGIEGFNLAQSDLAAAIEKERKRPAGEQRGVASLVVDMAENQHHPLRLKKPEYARLLGRWAVEHPDFEGRRRPILELAEHLLRLTGADRRLRGRLR